jgi:hypothetical protein
MLLGELVARMMHHAVRREGKSFRRFHVCPAPQKHHHTDG